jgi:hypothetical protein
VCAQMQVEVKQGGGLLLLLLLLMLVLLLLPQPLLERASLVGLDALHRRHVQVDVDCNA